MVNRWFVNTVSCCVLVSCITTQCGFVFSQKNTDVPSSALSENSFNKKQQSHIIYWAIGVVLFTVFLVAIWKALWYFLLWYNIRSKLEKLTDGLIVLCDDALVCSIFENKDYAEFREALSRFNSKKGDKLDILSAMNGLNVKFCNKGCNKKMEDHVNALKKFSAKADEIKSKAFSAFSFNSSLASYLKEANELLENFHKKYCEKYVEEGIERIVNGGLRIPKRGEPHKCKDYKLEDVEYGEQN